MKQLLLLGIFSLTLLSACEKEIMEGCFECTEYVTTNNPNNKDCLDEPWNFVLVSEKTVVKCDSSWLSVNNGFEPVEEVLKNEYLCTETLRPPGFGFAFEQDVYHITIRKTLCE